MIAPKKWKCGWLLRRQTHLSTNKQKNFQKSNKSGFWLLLFHKLFVKTSLLFGKQFVLTTLEHICKIFIIAVANNRIFTSIYKIVTNNNNYEAFVFYPLNCFGSLYFSCAKKMSWGWKQPEAICVKPISIAAPCRQISITESQPLIFKRFKTILTRRPQKITLIAHQSGMLRWYSAPGNTIGRDYV